jgi:O-acetyl-ADP-ribose deacetylase (regulator of RNase III)
MIEILRGDITTLEVDAIVNAANSSLAGGGGVDGAIHRAAGPQLVQASSALAPLRTGDAVITPGFNLPARYVIHTVGPVWQGGNSSEEQFLRSAYTRSFQVALDAGDIKTIAFPSISTGVYGYPKDDAAQVAVDVMHEFSPRFERIIACVFSDDDYRRYAMLLGERAR